MDRSTSIILVCLLNIALINAVPNCCKGENVIKKKKCIDNGILNIAPCESKVILMPNNTIEIDADENLLLNDGLYISPDQYCFTKTESTNDGIYVVCLTIDDTFEDTARSVLTIFQIVSAIFFLWTIIIYLMLPEMMDLQGVSIVQSIMGLMTAYIVLVSINFSGYINDVGCHIIAYVMYISFLYAFFWLNILCFHMWRQVINPKLLESVNNWKVIYYIYGIGGPLVCFIIVAIIHHWNPSALKNIHPGIGQGTCWFKSLRETMIYFYVPVTILLSMNVVYFIWMITVLWVQNRPFQQTKVLQYRLRLCAKLFVVMGLTWIFEVISAAMEYHGILLKYLWIVTDSINALQGPLVFLILVVCRKKVIRALANKKCLRNTIRFPTNWRYLQDSECEELEEDINLSMENK